jgi:hypothetical protein
LGYERKIEKKKKKHLSGKEVGLVGTGWLDSSGRRKKEKRKRNARH